MVEKKKVSTSTLNILINALKLYYGEILKKKFIYEVTFSPPPRGGASGGNFS